jgi:hypothetical protein
MTDQPMDHRDYLIRQHLPALIAANSVLALATRRHAVAASSE